VSLAVLVKETTMRIKQLIFLAASCTVFLACFVFDYYTSSIREGNELDVRGPWEQTSDAAETGTANALMLTSRAATRTYKATEVKATTDAATATALANEGAIPPATQTWVYQESLQRNIKVSYQDPVGDGRDCASGKPSTTPVQLAADLNKVSIQYDPEADRYLIQLWRGAWSGESGNWEKVVGGVEFYHKDYSHILDPNWFYNSQGDNSINFQVQPDGSIDISRWHIVDPFVGWEEVQDTKATGSLDENIIKIDIPRSEIFPEGGAASPEDIYWFPTITSDFLVCDDWGLDIDGTPVMTLTIGQESTFSATVPETDLNGIYLIGPFIIKKDIAGHGKYTNLPNGMRIKIYFSSIHFEGPAPWVNLSGDFNEKDGTFFAEGRGTVAGYPNIAVTYEGTLTENGISGDLTMGAKGGLPQGEPIVYQVEGQKVEELSEETSAVLPPEVLSAVNSFIQTFNTAFQNGDFETLFTLLHPAVINLYGADACRTYLKGVIENKVHLDLVKVSEEGTWIWEIDGRSIPLDSIYKVKVDFTVQDQKSQPDFHLYLPGDGSALWLTDCGEPLTQ
jgi:hypothetical protein